MIRPELLQLLHRPSAVDDKYSRGVVGFVTGSPEYPGAAILGVTAAMRCGAGLVRYLGPSEVAELVILARPEAVLQPGRADVWVLGSGLAKVSASVQQQLEGISIAVVDAAAIVELDLSKAPTRTVLTPHAGELAKLLSKLHEPLSRDEVELQPQRAALLAAQKTGCVVLLKGNTNYLATPQGEVREIGSLSTALATAGTGDVLAGALASLLASNSQAVAESQVVFLDVIELGVLLHSAAADLASAAGPVSALDVAESLRTVIEELI